MATYEYFLPELGEGIEAGDVIQVLVAVGEAITKDQAVVELETDKAVIEVPAPVSGIVQAIHVQAGDKAADWTAHYHAGNRDNARRCTAPVPEKAPRQRYPTRPSLPSKPLPR